MRKFLLMVALVLAIVVSLLAGTMAAYRTSDTYQSAEILAKTFSVSLKKSESATQGTESIKMAPGDSADFTYEITNDGEAAFQVTLNPEVVGELAAKMLTNAKVESSEGEKISDNVYTLAKGKKLVVTYTVTWPYDPFEDETEDAGKSCAFQLGIDAVSVNAQKGALDGSAQK